MHPSLSKWIWSVLCYVLGVKAHLEDRPPGFDMASELLDMLGLLLINKIGTMVRFCAQEVQMPINRYQWYSMR